MAELIERLMGVNTDGRPKIGAHQFYAAAYEWRLGNMSAAAATAAFELSAAEQTEAQAIVNTVPTAVATVANVVAHFRAAEAIHRVLLLAEHGVAPFDTPAAVRTRLGIPG